jgi:2-aminoethylphosphonate-pyruvate transaminase
MLARKEPVMTAFKGPDGQEDMPYLLTPGPVTTSRAIKLAMLADFGGDDAEFFANVQAIRRALLKLAGCDDSHVCVLLGGTHDHAVESVIGSIGPDKKKKTLIVSNGVDAQHTAALMQRLGKACVPLSYRESSIAAAADVAKALENDRNIAQVWITHCESSTGMLNPVADIGKVVAAHGRTFIVDASITFGGAPLSIVDDRIDVLIATSSTSLESLPGVAIVLARRDLLAAAKDRCHSPALDLHAQWHAMDDARQTVVPLPTHATLALREALNDLDHEGGIASRAARYALVARSLRERLHAMGFSLFLPDELASPFVQCVLSPKDEHFGFLQFHALLQQRGFAIARGTMVKHRSFRIGCMGHVNERVMQHLVLAMEDVLKSMEVRNFAAVSA